MHFKDTIQDKSELIDLVKKGYANQQSGIITKNDFLVFFGFTHHESILKYFPNDIEELLTAGGFATGNKAYFQAGINAGKHLKEGLYDLPLIVCNNRQIIEHHSTLQQIFYGAPGTGKSFHVDEVCKKHEHFRTTFHPDSDYSTFVGCYKPTMGKPQPIYGFDSVGKTVKVLDSNNSEVTRKDITYSFVPQSFTNAYIKAWELHESNTPVFLVVEEINRGNCAQIFGDLFQLLDRNDKGYSTYEITPDTDLQDYISQQGLNISGVTDSDDKDISAEIESGKLMKLPNNLHIWATMNTSDQSLFPIDSAFKRRWDWVYKPIKYDNEVWKVVLADGSWCWWVDLQQTLNDLIYDATESEDKMLGDWFVKAEKDEISEEVLVGKIIFYLWNDVAKVDAGKLFDLEVEKKFKKEGKENNKRKVIFSDFYEVSGNINSDVVKSWLQSNDIKLNDKETQSETHNETEPSTSALTKPEYVRILGKIEAKCKEQSIDYNTGGNSMNIKLGNYALSNLRVVVALDNTGTPNADVKLWISSSSANSIDTRDKLRELGAGEFFAELAAENSDNLSWEEIAKDALDTQSKTRGWRLRSTAITFEEANATDEAEWIFAKVQQLRERFATALD